MKLKLFLILLSMKIIIKKYLLSSAEQKYKTQ